MNRLSWSKHYTGVHTLLIPPLDRVIGQGVTHPPKSVGTWGESQMGDWVPSTNMAASSSKRMKLEKGTASTPTPVNPNPDFGDVTLYIIPQKISKSRVEFLNNLARKRGFGVADSFRYSHVTFCGWRTVWKKVAFFCFFVFSEDVTHVVTNYDSLEKVLRCLKRWVRVNALVVKRLLPLTITDLFSARCSCCCVALACF